KLGIDGQQVRYRRRVLGIISAQPKPKPLKKIIAEAGELPTPPALPIAPTERRFLVDQLQFRRAGGSFPDTEDKKLTAYLEQALAEVYSKSKQPIACPHCHSRYTRWERRSDSSALPRFKCLTCKRAFNRLTGTPLKQLARDRLPAFIPFLSQQIPYEEACRHLDICYPTVQSWTKKFRKWLLQLDPTGKWEAKVRLGIKTRPYIRCPRCGVDGEKRFFSDSPTAGRRLFCPACGSTFSVSDAERLAQQKVRLEIHYDPGKVDVDPVSAHQ
ncbi:DUF746 domain-containing protein, partial [Collimonas silvisoli]|uniref:DUF746 domain-containing protein n=1 Tax=Collimonas silvisoli TaxID=2825884 RepID=UPI001B8D0CC0